MKKKYIIHFSPAWRGKAPCIKADCYFCPFKCSTYSGDNSRRVETDQAGRDMLRSLASKKHINILLELEKNGD